MTAPPSEPMTGLDRGDAPKPLRLSIAHLLLWTLGTALALGMFRPVLEVPSQSSNPIAKQYYALVRVAALALMPFAGAAIGGIFLAISQLAKGRKSFPRQPGHWLLILYGISHLLMAGAVLLLLPRESLEMAALAAFYWSRAGIEAVMVMMQALPLVLLRDAPRWTVLFAVELARRLVALGVAVLYAIVFAVEYPSPAPAVLASGLNTIGLLVGVVTVLIVGIREIRTRPERDYLHWTGCIVLLAVLANQAAYLVMPYLLYR